MSGNTAHTLAHTLAEQHARHRCTGCRLDALVVDLVHGTIIIGIITASRSEAHRQALPATGRSDRRTSYAGRDHRLIRCSAALV